MAEQLARFVDNTFWVHRERVVWWIIIARDRPSLTRQQITTFLRAWGRVYCAPAWPDIPIQSVRGLGCRTTATSDGASQILRMLTWVQSLVWCVDVFGCVCPCGAVDLRMCRRTDTDQDETLEFSFHCLVKINTFHHLLPCCNILSQESLVSHSRMQVSASTQYRCTESRISALVIVVLSAMIGSSTFVPTRCSNPVAVWLNSPK